MFDQRVIVHVGVSFVSAQATGSVWHCQSSGGTLLHGQVGCLPSIVLSFASGRTPLVAVLLQPYGKASDKGHEA